MSNKNIEIDIGPGCCMNFIFISILLLALIFAFSIQVIIFCLLFLVLKNFTKINNIHNILISLLTTILISIIGKL